MLRALVALSLVATGCGSRCKEVHSARDALANRAPAARGADIRVTVPFERANTLFAESLAAQPLTVGVDAPSLGPVELAIPLISATVRDMRLLPGETGKIRFAIQIEVRDTDAEVGTLAMTVEVAPEIERTDGKTALAIGFGPENLISVTPELTADSKRSLGGAVSRWVPTRLRDKIPQPLLDAASSKLGKYLTGTAYEALRTTLLHRLGELTRLHLRLPDVPVAKVDLRSTPALLVVEILTDLPVRRGLAPSADDATDVRVAMSGSAVAELASWAIDKGHAPRWYTRGLKPAADGEFRPRFDYVAEDRDHPFKVYAFQERGGCSYFRVGARAQIGLAGDRLELTVLDRELEASAANPVIEAAAWVKYFLTGSIDQAKKVAAHTQITVGDRVLETRIVGATYAADELQFQLAFAPGVTRPARTAARAR